MLSLTKKMLNKKQKNISKMSKKYFNFLKAKNYWIKKILKKDAKLPKKLSLAKFFSFIKKILFKNFPKNFFCHLLISQRKFLPHPQSTIQKREWLDSFKHGALLIEMFWAKNKKKKNKNKLRRAFPLNWFI